MNFVDWIKNTWVIIVAVIGGITLIWNFVHKTLNEIKTEIKKPITEIDNKFEEVNKKLDLFSNSLNDKNYNDKLVINALQTIQRQSILSSCENCLKQGYANMRTRETLSKQIESYISLGGNSFIPELFEQVEALPIEKVKKESKNKTKNN